jgi:NAD(P)-dependent dehydrogenase (short-subunit alcohol dehydrogenase family)
VTLELLGYAGRRVVVTGCASGIGREVARLLVDAGAHVHGLDHVPTDLPLAAFHLTDLRYQDAIDAVVDAIAGPVDGLFACAGLPPMRSQIEVLTVNFIAVRYLTDRLLGQMTPGAAIVGVGSNGGGGWRNHLADIRDLLKTTSFAQAVDWCAGHPALIANAYGFSKETLAVWTMQHCAATIAHGVRLNCTSPGVVKTPMLDEIATVAPAAAIDAVAQPIGRWSSATEQAWPLLWLGSPLSSYINGVDLPVDGGFRAGQTLRD